MRHTVFKPIGIGYVMSNKKLREMEIEVYLPEQTNLRDGELLPATKDLEYELEDINELIRKGKITTGNTVPATWLPMTAHHLEAPSVRRGERVMVYNMADSEVYYWKEMGLDEDLRKLDTIVFAISATKDEQDTKLTATNTYWIEFSTHSKKVALVTTQADGEPFGYEMFLDTAKGTFRLIDTVNNYVELISEDNKIQMVTAEEAFAKVEKNTVQLQTPDGAEYFIDGKNIKSHNANGCKYSMIDDDIVLQSSKGGKITINADVAITNAMGSKLDLLAGIAKLEAGSGGALTIASGAISGP